LIAAFVASFFWMAAMTKFDISHVYPIVVGGLAILTAFFAIVFLKEPVSFTKIVGLFFVVLGVYFLSRVS
jgi:multidrug transporter EmrE-like cation transporter